MLILHRAFYLKEDDDWEEKRVREREGGEGGVVF